MPFGLSAGAIAAIGAGVSAAGSVAGSLLQSSATSKASKAAVGAQQAQQAQTRADLQPWTDSGQAASAQSADLLGLNGQDAADTAMSTFQASPGYAYQVQQGLRGVDAGAAARGMLRSGATIKAEETLGSNLANQDFANYYNRLAGMSQLGQTSAAGVGALGQQSAAGQAQTLASAGGAQAGIYGNAASGVTNAATGFLNNRQVQNQLAGFGTAPSGTVSGGFAAGGGDPFAGGFGA